MHLVSQMSDKQVAAKAKAKPALTLKKLGAMTQAAFHNQNSVIGAMYDALTPEQQAVVKAKISAGEGHNSGMELYNQARKANDA